ncbi:CYTH and CHAD domain-containing protein [Nocardioides sp.]|uniref:CYTH and CHAD domain-containing protein n=1 Tax=Nocardioides sp. TaxID=35761 RepID=UPI00271DD045|nr:CYTH and CHAD domain-containing protein [Nocardioides sp.]MDO9455806.1 CYTH and CHAD domain-containing protein [Nocardioides sp.]
MSDHHEIERAYAVDADDVLPDLTAVPGVERVGEATDAVLVATYVDTDDLALVRHGVTLRRRTGGDDAGWHLKIPAGRGRDEVHRPLGRDEVVPAVLARQVLGWTRGRRLHPVADIETHRTTTLLHAADGGALAEVADDRVTGRSTDGADPMSWREVEVELVGAGLELLDDVDTVLAEAGIRPRAEQRKIGSVLAHRLPPARPAPEADATAGRVLHARLADQVRALLRADSDVRRDVPDGVHQLRVACRRLRAALATYRPLVDETVTEPVRAELRWLARTLGDGRDAEVVQERLRAMVDDLPRTLVVGPVRRRVERTYADRRRAAATHAADVLVSRRYLRLLARLDLLVTSTPWTGTADEPAAVVLRRRVRKDVRRLRQRVELAEALAATDGAGPAHDEALHDVRKAAKRLRYACEVLEPVWGKDAKRLRKAAQAVTQVLGDRQDTAVARADLRRIARTASASGEGTFTYGVLWGRAEAAGREAEAAFGAAWRKVAADDRRAWLD